MERIAVVGLGYVGLPVAVGLARIYPHTVGFDVDRARVAGLMGAEDRTGEMASDKLWGVPIHYTTDPEDMRGCTFFIVTVPTPIDEHRRPDLTAVMRASETVGRVMGPGAVVVYESTVYPGVTEEICGPILARESGLDRGQFKLGYSPERINPGDPHHTLETIRKVVSGEDAETLDRVAAVYGSVVKAGIHRAPSIMVAEAAKVIENTQRDLNIALMNELAVIFDLLGLRTADVLAAARSKWNFLPFVPGLVGGHCIGVDPYYLTARAEMAGYHPEVILAGRRINDNMGRYVAQRVIRHLNRAGLAGSKVRVGVLGLTFKEDIRDPRNSRVPDIIHELEGFGVTVLAWDPNVEPAVAHEEWGLRISPPVEMVDLDALILAVAHRPFMVDLPGEIGRRLRPGGLFFDVKSVLDPSAIPAGFHYQSL